MLFVGGTGGREVSVFTWSARNCWTGQFRGVVCELGNITGGFGAWTESPAFMCANLLSIFAAIFKQCFFFVGRGVSGISCAISADDSVAAMRLPRNLTFSSRGCRRLAIKESEQNELSKNRRPDIPVWQEKTGRNACPPGCDWSTYFVTDANCRPSGTNPHFSAFQTSHGGMRRRRSVVYAITLLLSSLFLGQLEIIFMPIRADRSKASGLSFLFSLSGLL